MAKVLLEFAMELAKELGRRIGALIGRLLERHFGLEEEAPAPPVGLEIGDLPIGEVSDDR